MTPEALLQLTRELVTSPHFSYQPQMRLRNGAIVLDVDPSGRELYVFDDGELRGVVLIPHNVHDDWLPDLEDDATVGVLRGMAQAKISQIEQAGYKLSIPHLRWFESGAGLARLLIRLPSPPSDR